MDRRAFWVALGVVALAVGGGAYHYMKGGAPGHASEARAAPSKQGVAVEAERVTLGTVTEDIRAVGSLRPNESVVVSPEIAGRIVKIRFAEGEKVKAGDVLVELDSAILRAELAKARSDLTLAGANRERALTLAHQGSGTLRARDEALATYQVAQANVALAEARLKRATIAAPLSGKVGLRAVSTGAYVTPGDRIVELVDIDPIKVDFRVPELALSSVRVGQPIRVTVDALPGKEFNGDVYAIDPIVDANGRAVQLRARVANADGELWPGLFARVQVVVERRENAVVVPESAVFAQRKKTFVYRVVDGRAALTEVELGQRRPGQVEVRRGLERDAVVITAGQQQVRDGAAVEVVKANAGS